MKFSYKAGFYVLLAATGWIMFGGYVMGINTSGIHGPPGCTVIFTGQIPSALKPAFHAKYGNQSDNGIYSVYFCNGAPTDQVKDCTQLSPADAPVMFRSFLPSTASLYSCKTN